jgi:hypothetical protein
MFLVQILLPLYDNDGAALPHDLFGQVRSEMVDRFGGVTSYSRAPAKGHWQEEDGDTVRDDLVVYEVMVEAIDGAWWRDYKHYLEQQFRQESIVVRAQTIRLL